jgi:hypothetical protein
MINVKFSRIKIIYIISLCMIFPGFFCSKKGGTVFYDCPAFRDSLYDQWFPYVKSQVLRFRNSTGIENTINLERVDKTPDYKYYVEGGGSCAPKVTVRSAGTIGFATGFLLEYSKGPNISGLSINLKSILITAREIKDTGIVLYQNTTTRFNMTRYFSTYALNGKSYSNVQIITRDTAADKTLDIYKVLIAKGTGILGYEEYPSLELWLKQ